MKAFFFFSSIILLVSCGHSNKPMSHDDSLKLMMATLDSAIDEVITGDSSWAPKIVDTPPAPKKEVVVNEGIVYYTLPYCGGTRPSEEIIAEKKKSRLLTNSTLKLKSKKGEYLVTTNDKGIFRSGIPAGTYEVYLTEKINKAIYNVSPETCEDCLAKSMALIMINEGRQASFVIHFACAPGDKKRQ